MVTMDKFQIQDAQYKEPYHHFVSFDRPAQFKELNWGSEYYAYLRRVMDEFALLNAKTVADVGCGDGKLIYELAPKYPQTQFSGYDLSEQSILFAKAYGHGISNARFFLEDFASSQEKYDVIFCIETFEHISDEETPAFTQTLIDHLNPGGYLIATVPSIHQPLNKKHYRHYSTESLAAQVGLSPLRLEYIAAGRSSFLSNRLFLLNVPVLFKRLAQRKGNKHVLGVFKKI